MKIMDAMKHTNHRRYVTSSTSWNPYCSTNSTSLRGLPRDFGEYQRHADRDLSTPFDHALVVKERAEGVRELLGVSVGIVESFLEAVEHDADDDALRLPRVGIGAVDTEVMGREWQFGDSKELNASLSE